MGQTQNDRPYKTIRAGKMSIALWKKEVTGKEGGLFMQYSAKIQKRYRNPETGDWETTEYLYRHDLADLIACAQKAYETVSLTETELGQQQFIPDQQQ